MVSKGFSSDLPAGAVAAMVVKMSFQSNWYRKNTIRIRKTTLQNIPCAKSVTMIAICPPKHANAAPSPMKSVSSSA